MNIGIPENPHPSLVFGHHAIVVTSSNELGLLSLRAKATECGLTTTTVARSPCNGFRSFLVVPDGSADGWDLSTEGDNQRDHFVQELEWYANNIRENSLKEKFSWVEVEYGEATSVTRCSGQEKPDDVMQEGMET